ncbi:Beta-glucosidase 13 [Linum perenne]
MRSTDHRQSMTRIIIALILCTAAGFVFGHEESMIRRDSFPEGFVFGTASSAYQYEGAVNEDGRGPSIWDTFTEKYPEKIRDHSSGANGTDSYHRYKEDVSMMKSLGFDAYRFSISWSRILPRGTIGGGINQQGIDYYNNLIHELISNGIQPVVTLFHWDLPQALESKYGGFLSSKIVDDFRGYAELCFNKFGDRVKQWITLNEPFSYASSGYGDGSMAPGRCSTASGFNCTAGGDSGTEPYIVAHHLLLAHAAVVKLYRDKFQVVQKGKIGITLISPWAIPLTNSNTDRVAASRYIDFQFGWYMGPITSGSYPENMVKLVGKRLPKFSREESRILKGSYDFLGLNYYTSSYVTDAACPNHNVDILEIKSSSLNYSGQRNGIPIGPQAGSEWLYVYPEGIQHLLVYIKHKYNDPLIYITENGRHRVSELDESGSSSLNDSLRVDSYTRHLAFVRNAIFYGVNVKGFFAWSLLDNFEWRDGYLVRFGLVHVDYKHGLKRSPKKSAYWFKRFLSHHPKRPAASTSTTTHSFTAYYDKLRRFYMSF